MINFKCPACSSVLEVSDKFAGAKGDCIVCKHSFVAPTSSTVKSDGSPVDGVGEAYDGNQAIEDGSDLDNTSLSKLINNFNRLLVILGAMNKQIAGLRSLVNDLRHDNDLALHDLTTMFVQHLKPFAPPKVSLVTDHSVAETTVDHLHPRGTANDNTRWPRFVAACERHFQRPLKYIDLGCAGGGLVLDFLLRGHRAIGLEGSDFSPRTLRAEWRVIRDHLFTCDVTKPFQVLEQTVNQPYLADVITAWEVLEHIPKEALPGLFANIRNHLAPDGIFVASVAMYDDYDTALDVHYHATIENRDWWEDTLWENGLEVIDEPIFLMHDFCRGIGARATDACYVPVPWDSEAGTHRFPGFHIVVKHLPPGKPKKQRPIAEKTLESNSNEQAPAGPSNVA